MSAAPVESPERRIHRLVGQFAEIDAGRADHLAEFARGEHGVDVASAAGAHLRPLALELLGGAGHDGGDEDLLGLQAEFLGIVGLGQRAEHLLRRLAGREVGQDLRMEVLGEQDPAGRTAGEHRQGHRFLVHQRPSQAREQFRAFLQDRHVGGEVRVEHGIESEPPQGGRHFAGDERAGRIAEALAQRGANGRRRLHDDMLVRIIDRVPHAVDIGLLGDGADGTDRGALAALHAGHRGQVAIEGRADGGVEAASLRPTGADVLRLGADAHAATALDALAVVAHQAGRRQIDALARLLAGVADGANAEFGGERLQFAVLAAVARLAVAVVLGQQHLDHQAARLAHAARVGPDAHAFGRPAWSRTRPD